MKRLPQVAAKLARQLPGALAGVLRDLARLEVPTIATAVATIAAPTVAAVAGVNVTAVELGPWLVAMGAVAAAVQRITASKPAPAKPSGK